MSRPATVVVALAMLGPLAAGGLAREVIGGQKAEYPPEWGENVAAAAAGARIVDQAGAHRGELGADNLIDGDVTPDRPSWSVEPPQRGRPAPFAIVGWEQLRTIDRVAFHNDMRVKGSYVKEVRVSFSKDGQTYATVRPFTLQPNPGLQSFDVTPPEQARFLRIEVAGRYGNSFVVLEEAAAFEGSAARARMFRGTTKHDVMELKNRDRLTGLMQNETIEVQTSYARLILNRESIANIMFEGGTANIERITMVNGDTFSGFILTKTILFSLDKGQTIDIRKDKVHRLGMRLRPDERRSHPRNDVVFLKNGDIFNGQVLNPSLTIKTSYATITNQIADIARIEFTGDSKIVTKITLKNNNTMQGLLEEEDIEIHLDHGPTIMVYKDKIDKMEMRK